MIPDFKLNIDDQEITIPTENYVEYVMGICRFNIN
jgi:hypothetical protein